MQYVGDPTLDTVGYLGEVREGLDGQLYQYTETIDGLGNIGFAWASLIPIAAQVASQVAPALIQALPGVIKGISSAMQSGTVSGLGEADLYDQPQIGEVREGLDGQLYQYTETVDGLGNIGFAWASLIPLAAQAIPSAVRAFRRRSGRRRRRGQRRGRRRRSGSTQFSAMLRQSMPQIAQMAARMLAQQRGLGGLDEYEDLYGLDEYDDALYGLDEDLDIDGLEEDLELDGLEEDLELYGLEEDLEIEGLHEDPELFGLEEYMDDDIGMLEDDLALGDYFGEEELDGFHGLEEDYPDEVMGMDGYLKEEPPGRLNGYVKGAPTPSPRFQERKTTPEMWKPLWS